MKNNKQHDVRAASFKRIAKECRAYSRDQKFPRHSFFNVMAKFFEAEAKLLRSMR